MAATTVNGASAGGEFLLKSPGAPDIVDISAEMKRNCSQVAQTTTAEGVVLKVLFEPSLESLVETSLEMMQEVHDALVAELGFAFKTSARLYLVQLGSYPKSFRAVDRDYGTPRWAFLRTDLTNEERVNVIEGEIYGLFPHEWAHDIFNEKYGSKSKLWKARWVVEGIATYLQHLVQWRVAPQTNDPWRGLRIPIFALADTTLDDLVEWKFLRTIPPDQERLVQDRECYLAAAGLFLRVRAKSGSAGVGALLDRLRDNGKIRVKDLELALVQVTGSGFSNLSSISPEEREAALSEALAALNGPERKRRLYGLALLNRLPEHSAQYQERIRRLLASPEIDGGVRRVAEELIERVPADQ